MEEGEPLNEIKLIYNFINRGDFRLESIKAFLKKDSDILRNILLFLFCLINGVTKLIYDHRISGIFIGLICATGSLFLFVEILKEFKRLMK